MFKRFGPQLIFLIFFYLLIELSILPYLSIKGVRPDLFFVLVGFYAFFIYPSKTPHFAIFLGLIRELFSGTLLGCEVLSYGISGFLLWFLVMKMDRENPLNQMSLLFLYSFTNLLILGILNASLTDSSFTFSMVLSKIFGVSLYTTLIAPLLFFLMKHFFGFYQKDLFGRRLVRR